MTRADAASEPPRLAVALLRALIADAEQESYLGDLLELHAMERVPTLGATRARLAFWRDTLVALATLPWRRADAPTRHGDPTLVRMLTDLRQAARQLRRAPGFAALSALTLALGIGATTAVFSVAYSTLLRPLPFPNADRLVAVATWVDGERSTVSPPDFDDWRRESRTTDLAASIATTAALSGDGPAEQIAIGAVTADFFRVHGVSAALGHTFTPAEAAHGGPRTVVLSRGLWARRFGSDTAIVGRAIRLDGESYVVAGVMPDGFDTPARAEAWKPLTFSPEELSTQRGAHYLRVVGRLRPGATLDGARTELGAIAARLEAAYPKSNTGAGIELRTLRTARVGTVRSALLVLLGAVGLLLLLACANVANLLLVRAARRERERVVRAALGAGRAALARAVLAEALVLAVLGGVAGIVLAWWGTAALDATMRAARPSLAAARVDAPVLAFAILASLCTAFVFGLLPAITAGRVRELATTLRGSAPVGARARGATAWRWGWRMRGSLVLTQVAITTVLLAGAALLAQSFVRLRGVDAGFEPRGVWTLSFALPDERYTPERSAVLVSTLLDRVRDLPGVRAAGATMGLPLSGISYGISYRDVDGVPEDAAHARETEVRVVTDDYFRAMGMRLVRGRPILPTDDASSPRVVVVNERLARTLWPGQDPIGHVFTLGTRFGVSTERAGGTVVGVVADTRDGWLGENPPPQTFVAHRQFPVGRMTLAVRGDVTPTLVRALGAQLAALDPEVPAFDERALDALVADSVAEPRLYAILLAAFAGTALLLAAVGVYGVVSLAVGQRTREFGVRVALGAPRGSVVRLVLRQALTPVAAGLVVGLAGAWAAGRVLASLLFGTSATDPLALGAVVVVLGVTAATAVYLPARRATGIMPRDALRAE